eukprot:CAMPEP_0119118780 /NCGR_PEP_ID=MMETSP1310-20130426/542_1 /TAXON_ID=464262 /ORGANISM="Genus nov. species nov., Strain RCC2339" /LENGTH=387 /DNA_ID=CAMNT_0007108171 /DNA_START=428 /DNA_END=1591 /DNA_ORIENTATION=-
MIIVVNGMLLLKPLPGMNNHFWAAVFVWVFLIYTRIACNISGLGNGMQLILTLRLTSICWDMYDEEERQRQGVKNTDGVPGVPRSSYDIWCYSLGILGLFTGPFFTYDEWMSSIHSTHMSKGRWHKDERFSRKEGGEGWVWKAVQGVFFVAMFGIWNKFLPLSSLKTDWFLELPFPLRMAYFVAATYNARFRFYFAWKMAEAACVAAGIARPFDVLTIDVFLLETAISPAIFTKHWNVTVVRFLDCYVRRRIPPQIPRGFHVWMVFLTSAVWHGVEPMYYVAFLNGALWVLASSSVAKMYNMLFGPLADRSPAVQSALLFAAYLATVVEMNFGGGLFSLLKFEDTLRVISSLYFYGIIAPLVCIIAHQVCKAVVPRKSPRSSSGKAS